MAGKNTVAFNGISLPHTSYAELSRRTGTPEKSLGRMLGSTGNSTAANMFSVLPQLQRYSGVRLQVSSARVPRKRPAKVGSASARRVA